MRGYRKLVALPLIFAAMGLARPCAARGQSDAFSGDADIHFGLAPTRPMTCAERISSQPVTAALRLACVRDRLAAEDIALSNVIVIGFVGGFVRHDDVRHPEVEFAGLLRERYRSVHAEVFANHDGKRALRRVLQLLDTNRDGALSTDEEGQARIIIYGHSWGGSQAVTLARQLERKSSVADDPGRQRP